MQRLDSVKPAGGGPQAVSLMLYDNQDNTIREVACSVPFGLTVAAGKYVWGQGLGSMTAMVVQPTRGGRITQGRISVSHLSAPQMKKDNFSTSATIMGYQL